MSRVLRWSLRGLAALTLLLALGWGWLFHSGSGRDFVLARVHAALRAQQPQWQTVGGTLGGGMVLEHFGLQTQTLRVEASQLALGIDAAALWRGTLRLEPLRVRGLRLTPLAAPAPADAAPSPWPTRWPSLPLPLRVEIPQLRIDDLAWLARPEAPLVAQRLTAAMSLSADHVAITALGVNGENGRLSGDGNIGLGEHSALDLRLALTAIAGDATPWHAQLDVNGTPMAIKLQIAGNAPGDFSLSGELHRQQDQWRWQAQMRARDLVPAQLGGPAGRFGGDLSLRGIDARATVSGALQRDALTVTIAPSTLLWQAPHLTLSPLQLGVADGQLTIDGDFEMRQDSPRLTAQLRATALRWGEGAQQTRISGEAHVDGWIDDWALRGEAELAHADLRGQLRLDADGDAQHAQLHDLSIVTAAGRSQLAGEVRYADALQWQLDGRLQGLDPGWFMADFPGTLNARIASRGRWREGTREVHARIDAVTGRLRQRPVRGSAVLDIAGTTTAVDVDAHVGDSHVRVAGRLGERIDARIALAPLQLADLWPQAQGTLRGEVRVRGPRAQPQLVGELQGSALALSGVSATALHLRARDDGTAASHGSVQLHLDDVAIDGLDLGRIEAELDGQLEQAQLRLTAQSAALNIELAGAWTAHGAQGQFALQSLRLTPAQGAPWRLRQPLQIDRGAAWHVPSLCLDSDDGDVCVQGDWPGTLTLRAHALDLALAQPWLQRDDVHFALAGQLDVDASVRGGGALPLQGHADIRSDGGSLQLLPVTRKPAFAWRSVSLQADVDASGWNTTLNAQTGAEGHIDGHVAGSRDADGPLHGEATLQVTQLAWLELFSPDLAAPSGRVQGRLTLSGSRAAPRFGGELALQAFAAELPALGLALRDSSVRIDADADGRLRLDAQLDSGEGVLQVDGEGMFDANAPMTLHLGGERVKISDTAELGASISPALTVQRAQGVLSVSGRIDVPVAHVALDKRQASAAARSADVVVIDPQQAEDTQPALPLALDVDVQVGKDVRLSGFGIDGKLGGALHVVQVRGREALGTGTVTASGKYERYGKPLEIGHARLIYTRSPLDDPALDIRAQRTVDSQMVGVQIGGTALRPITTLISDPALENSETLSWLVLGHPLRTAQAGEGTQLNAAAMALGAGGNLIAGQLGSRLGLDQAGVSESRALGANTLNVGKYLSPRLYLSYGVSLLGSGQVVALKYLLGGGFDVEIESGPENRGSLNWRTER